MKKVRDMSFGELHRCISIGTTAFEHQYGINDFILKHYFSDKNKNMILTYKDNEIVGFHQTSIIILDDARVINHDFSVVHPDHRLKGIDYSANNFRYNWAMENDCDCASFKSRSPFLIEKRMKEKFQNPLITPNEDISSDIVYLGKKISYFLGENTNNNLVVEINNPKIVPFYSKPITMPARNDKINKIIRELDSNKRLRFVRKF